MKCIFECSFIDTCLFFLECDGGKRNICGEKCSAKCFKCSFKSVCSINKQKEKVREND